MDAIWDDEWVCQMMGVLDGSTCPKGAVSGVFRPH